MKELELSKTEYKAKADICGNKIDAINSIMQHLETRMSKAGAKNTDIMHFEKAFLESNGIRVPAEFLERTYCSINDSLLTQFVRCCLVDAEENLSGIEFYNSYVKYCILKNEKYLGKKKVFEFLKVDGLMKKTGTINGKTQYNVIPHKRIAESVADNAEI